MKNKHLALRGILPLVLLLGTLAGFACAQTNWELVWADEFNGNSLDMTKWAYEIDCAGGGNNQLQCYTGRKENVRVQNGSLVIEARVERYKGTNTGCTSKYGGTSCTNTRDYTSGRIRSKFSPTGSWTYGRFELRAKLPTGRNLWPALWMLPTDEKYGMWAASGEIDILEARGQEPNVVQGTLHYGAGWPKNRHRGSGSVPIAGQNFQTGFHVHAVEWEPTEMRWFVDDRMYFKMALNRSWYEGSDPSLNPYSKIGQPWDQRFHYVINLAIGGAWFPTSKYGTFTLEDAKKWPNPVLHVDYARVYKKSSKPATSTTAKPATTTKPATSTTSKPAASTSSSSSGSGTSYKLVWSDEFTGSSLDKTKWAPDVDCYGGGNGQLQCHTTRSDNLRVENGFLYMSAKQETYKGTSTGCTITTDNTCTATRSYTSSRIVSNTKNGATWKYGKIEMRAKMPRGNFLQPSFMLLPTDNKWGKYAASGQIDMWEMRGQTTKVLDSTIHYGAAWPNNRALSNAANLDYELPRDFHVYSFEWDASNMNWYMDNKLVWTQKVNRDWNPSGLKTYSAAGQPWDQRFHLAIDLIVGGSAFPSGTYGTLTTTAAKAWENPKIMVDWIRVYQKVSSSNNIDDGNEEGHDDTEPALTENEIVDNNDNVVDGESSNNNNNNKTNVAAIVAPVVIGCVALAAIAALAAMAVIRKRQGKSMLPFTNSQTSSTTDSAAPKELELSPSNSSGEITPEENVLQAVNSSCALLPDN